MNEHVWQIVLTLINVAGTLAWWAIRGEIKHVRELLSVRLDEHERRLERVEEKCSDCPSSH